MPGALQAGLQLGLQAAAHLVGVAAQRDPVLVVVVVGVLVGEVAQRGLALDDHELAEVLDIEHRPAVSVTRHTTTAAISIGLPRASLTLIRSLWKLRTRMETVSRESTVNGFTHHSPESRSVPM